MYNKDYQEEGGGMGMGGGQMSGGCMSHMHMHHWPMKMKKEFMAAMLRKKEKMLEAKLAFVREMKDLTEKMPDEMKEEKEVK
jgi:hypothetical protein